MQIPHPSGGNLDAITAGTGALVRAKVGAGVTLANATVYYFMLGGEDAPLEHVQLKWDTAFVGVFTIETCAFPRKLGVGSDSDDVTDTDETEGNWIKEDPPTAYVALDGTGGAGAATVANLTVTVAGGSAGGCSIHLGNLGALRCRVKAVVTTGGLVRAGCNRKA